MLPYLVFDNHSLLFLLFELLIIYLFYFLFRITIFNKLKIITKKYIKYGIYVIFGGLITLLFFIISTFYKHVIYPNSNFYFLPFITFLFLYMIAYKHHFVIAISGFLTSFIYISYLNNFIFDINLIFFLICIITTFSSAILHKFLIKKTSKFSFVINCFISYAIICAIFVLTIYFMHVSINNLVGYFLLFLLATFFISIVDLLDMSLMNFINKTINKSMQLIYVEEHFILPKLVPIYFKNLIKKTNKKYFWIITFSFQNLDTIKKTMVNKQQYHEFEQYFLKSVANIFEKFNGFLFKSKYGEYGAIIPVTNQYFCNLSKEYNGNSLQSRDDSDTLKKIEIALSALNKPINFDKKIFYIDAKAIVSIYGIHGTDLDDLINKNYLYLKQFIVFNNNLIKNCVQLVNPKYMLQIINQIQNYKKILNLTNFNEFEIELSTIKINKQYFVRPQYFWLKKFTCNFSKILSYFDYQTGCLLQRYLALKAIEKYSCIKEKQYKLLVDYPISELNSITFSANKILKKISVFNLKNNDIVLYFNSKNFIKNTNFLNNLEDLKRNNIAYILIE